MTIADIFRNDSTRLHHFYIIEGVNEASTLQLQDLLIARGSGFSRAQVFTYSTLGVEEAQFLRQQQDQFALDGGEQFFILSAASVTHEAQQMLLKMFEEPKSNTHFFLLMPEATAILPTVKSRAQTISITPDTLKYAAEAKDFITASKDKRIAFVAEFVKSHEDDDSSGELRLHASQFVTALIELLRKDPKNLISRKDFFKDALEMREYLDSRGASVKMILEHLSLIL